jgi:hypothetical protein
MRILIGSLSAAACLLAGCAAVAPPAVTPAAPAGSPHGTWYGDVAPMNATVEQRLMPQVDALLHKLIAEQRDMRLDGVPVFESGDKFLPGKIAIGLSYLILATAPDDPRRREYLAAYRQIADMTLDMPNETWGIYYYISALQNLAKAGLLDEAVAPATLAELRRKLDWRSFVRDDLTLIDLPNNYYGVAFSIARLRMLLGWADASASEQLLARTLDHYRAYSGAYGFADETDGEGRFDRYSVLLIGEIAQRLVETGMTPSDEVKAWLRKSVDLLLPRFNMTGEGFEYGRSIGTYGETAFLEVLTAAARLGLLSDTEMEMAYAFSSRITARYADFWINPQTGSVDMWDGGRRTDTYRAKHRILGENLSLARQYFYTNAIWNDLGFRDRRPTDGYARWLTSLPRSSHIYFARGEYDRALVTLRDQGHVIGLPLINGGRGQHMNNPYFPVPYSTGLLSGSADATYPHLVPRFTLADGSVLMPLAWFKDVQVRHDPGRTTVTYRLDEMDGMGGEAPRKDDRIRVQTRYVFTPGRIERYDEYSFAAGLAGAIDLEFASFSRDPAAEGSNAVTFGQGEVRSFAASGFDGCRGEPVAAAPYQAPSGPLHSRVTCRSAERPLGSALSLKWVITYDKKAATQAD